MVTHVKSVDPRVKRTNQLLQQALLELSREKRFASITVQDIAQRAMVNRATFYAHFEDKYELVESIIREQFQQMVASKLPMASRGGVNSLRVLIGAVFDYFSEVQSRRQPTDAQLEPMVEQIVQQELSKFLVSWLEQTPVPRTARRVPVATMASMMSWAMFGAAVQWNRAARTTTKEQMVNQVLSVLTEGMTHLIPEAPDPG